MGMVVRDLEFEMQLDPRLFGVVGVGVVCQVAWKNQQHPFGWIDQFRAQPLPGKLLESKRPARVDQDEGARVISALRGGPGVMAEKKYRRKIGVFAVQGQGLALMHDHFAPCQGRHLAAVLGINHLLEQSADGRKIVRAMQALPTQTGPRLAMRVEALVQFKGPRAHPLHLFKREGMHTEIHPRAKQILSLGSGCRHHWHH